MQSTTPTAAATDKQPWYAGVGRYEWTVLAIASAGWVFDVFEGQIFGSCMNEALPVLLRGTGNEPFQETFVNLGLGAFLAGGALGGLYFGMMADRWGRRWTMALTILVYSIFTGLTAFAQDAWQLIVLRFLVGLGVGGEWAVAAAVVAEVFPPRARPAASGIFHASSVLGTYMAVAAGLFVVSADRENGWRYGFLLGVLPALLILAVRIGMREPETWQSAREHSTGAGAKKLGRFRDLWLEPVLRYRTLIATSLAIIGLATFWGAHFRGKDVVRELERKQQTESQGMPLTAASMTGLLSTPMGAGPLAAASTTLPDVQQVRLDNPRLKRYEMLAMFLATTGGGLGLLSFAPISQRLGRRPAFLLFHVGGFALTAVLFLAADSMTALIFVLPVFGFFTLGMHAGYAVYFPELYPTRLRGTGAGFCFNMARIVVVPVLLLFAWLQDGLGLGLARAMLILAGLYLVGCVLALLAPETRGQPLPE